QQLIERVFALIISALESIAAACTSDGINLVDKYNTGCFFPCLLKEVANARCTNANKHFHKVGTGHGKERNTCLSGYSLGEKGFTSSRRTYQQHTLGDLATEGGILLRIFEKIDYFHYLFLGFFKTGNVGECHGDLGVFFK